METTELQERETFIKGTFTPSFPTERQIGRVARQRTTFVFACALCGVVLMSQIGRIGMAVARVLIFEQPIYSIVSLYVAVTCILAAVGFLIWTLFSPRRFAKRSMRQIKERYETVPTRTLTFGEDGIAISSDGEPGMRFAYGAIKCCIETSDLFVFRTKEKQLFAVEKQTLEPVDAQGFHALIRAKCPKARHNWRDAA